MGNKHKAITIQVWFWISQNIGDINIFLTTFKQRLIDCSKQDWYGKIEITDKLYTYATFKSLLEVEKYLNCIYVNKYKVALSRFRCSNHVLNIECGRWKNVERNERLCELCSRIHIYDIEDEYHLLCCHSYNDLRNKYIPSTVCTKEGFINLMRIFYSTFLHIYTMQCKGEKVCIDICKINIIYM